ncbi:hypothetical protein D3C85_1580630 [compost metagenome]
MPPPPQPVDQMRIAGRDASGRNVPPAEPRQVLLNDPFLVYVYLLRTFVIVID